jgi:4-aminobutyrate aminotransferase-like enzyme
MAIQLARAYTGNHDVIIFEESFHGGLSTGADMSAKMMVKIDNGKDEDRSQSPDLAQMCKKPKLDSFQVDLSDAISYEEDYDDSNPRSDTTSTTSSTPHNLHLDGTDNDENRWPGISAPLYKDKPDWVHVLPVPDLTRGYYSNDEPSVAIEKYISDAKTIINTHIRRGRRIACLLSEPAFTFYNGTIPSTPYFEKISSYVREIGGLVIMDEVQSGLGRIGHHWWGFQVHKMEPDIVTAGKALNNGHPISFLFTSHKILSSLGGQSLLDVHRPTPIQEALGNCVLDIMLEERLLDNCKDVGNFIESSMQRYLCVFYF